MDEPRKPAEEQKNAYDEGARAFQGESNKAKDPHAEGSVVAKYWESGFLDAQKALFHRR